jgi:hypothetical protein
MYKFLTIALLFVSTALNAQDSIIVQRVDNTITFQQVDSLTYHYYYSGDWDKLIEIGEKAISHNIDYKKLRQRMGFAYFTKADYYAARSQYEKALTFDNSDIDTRIYLYYCGLYTGNESYSRYQAGKLPVETQKSLAANPFRIIDAVDVEYNYKSNNSPLYHNSNYWRLGLNTKLGYRLNLYQAISNYTQKVDSAGGQYDFLSKAAINQTDYFASLNWTLNPHLNFTFGYHYINLQVVDSISYQISLLPEKKIVNNTYYDGHLFFSKIDYKINRFDLGLTASLFNYNNSLTQQYGVQAGVILPGILNLMIKSALFAMFDNNSQRLIYSQTLGAYVLRNIWLEGNLTFGNLKNYAEYDGLYVYNVDDPTIIKSGLSLYWSLTKNISFFGNYSFNLKKSQTYNTNYNQHSFSGGVIWKL